MCGLRDRLHENRADTLTVKDLKPESTEVTIAYRARQQFLPLHSRAERFACIVTHRRAGKTVACIHDLHRGALTCERTRPRFAYMSPFLKQAKSVAWDYLRAAVAAGRQAGASIHESELRVDYPNGAQVRLFGADNADALRGLYLDGITVSATIGIDWSIFQKSSARAASPVCQKRPSATAMCHRPPRSSRADCEKSTA